MIETFITSFKLKNTYRVNSIIYSIKGLPIIKKILPNSLYKNNGLKILANVLSILWELINTFFGKFIYILFMIFSMVSIYKTNSADAFLHIFTFLTIIGGIMNTYMFNPTKDKYYAIVLMGMNANKYAVSNYFYSMLKILIGFLPFTIIYGIMVKIPLWICILIPILVVMIKMICIYCDIRKYKLKGIATNENSPSMKTWILIALLVAIAYGLPYIGYVLNQTTFIVIFGISLVLGLYSLKEIVTFTDYQKLFKLLLTTDNVYAAQKAKSTEVIKNNIAKNIEYDESVSSQKKGFAYFHELFVKRHKKILTKAVIKQTFFIIFIFAIIVMISYAIPQIRESLNKIPLTYLPYCVFIMYLLNRGTIITQAMFMNCDHSMLTFRIYRTPKVILGIFKERLKTLITLNLLPASAVGLGLVAILYVTGGTANALNYFILFISVNAMSVFFSVHYLVMYYLLQPYNVNTELKNSTYLVVQSLTYLVCYFMIQLQFPTLQFGIITIIFSIAYSVISLLLVYKFAPKTFKIRI